MKPDYEIVAFSTAQYWREWLETNHANTDGVWLRMYKKASGVPSVTYAQALDDALCYGWIDGQSKSYDDVSFIQKFTPRRARSMWSKRNIEHVARLETEGLMKPAGLAEAERAKADGRWQVAYDKPTDMVIPKDFLAAINKNKKALATFETLNRTSLFTIGFKLQTAKKPETRANRMDALIKLLEEGKKP
ncbi:MAG: YdeI/OmpD-associated family protein [Candidatus Saccharimonadales bacterium]